MKDLKVRIGIDVGGTFTDAIILNNETGEIIAKEKTPTTHYAVEGVATGIIYLITKLMQENNISPADVVFIAHGTTQATNALLEGDVAKIGLIGIGSSSSAKKEVSLQNIELAPNKFLEIENVYIEEKLFSKDTVLNAIELFKNKKIDVVVSSQAFSVDDSSCEILVNKCAQEQNLYSTSGHEISQLYGLKTRTRTAVVNGSLIPKMMETANLTEKVVKEIGIKSELMIMRADGGVMSIQEVRKRPILTMLSGLAAGVAGVLMYEKLTDGVFFEAGGTSTDISVIKDGKVMIKNAQVGGHKTYLNSLDVRTIGIAGGSMIRIENNKISDVGPRSAHLAKLEYECFATEKNFNNAQIKLISPLKGDPANYVVIEQDKKCYAFSLCGAANVLKYIDESDYAYAKQDINFQAWSCLATYLNTTVEKVASEVIKQACSKIWTIVEPMMNEYELEKDFITFVGGGGSASVITKPLAHLYNYKHKIAKNAPYISTIGVAMAMLREEIERSIINPSNDDIKKLRNEVFEKIIKSGANEQSIEITINVDTQKNIVKAVATGASEFKSKDYNTKCLNDEEKCNKVLKAFSAKAEEIEGIQHCGKWSVVNVQKNTKKFFGLISNKAKKTAIINSDGVIVLRKNNASTNLCQKNTLNQVLNQVVEDKSLYSDAGQTIPQLYVLSKTRLFDYSGLISLEQIKSLIQMDLEFTGNNDEICIIAVSK